MALYRDNELSIYRSTFSGNSANGFGGALAVENTTVSIFHSAFVKNIADANEDDYGDGGGLYLEGSTSLTMKNTIIALNKDKSPVDLSHPDISLDATSSVTFNTMGFNFIGDNETVSSAFPMPAFPGGQNLQGDYVGDTAAPLEPVLGTLHNNGGPTNTHVPLAGSPIIDQGHCTLAKVDQRGFSNSSTTNTTRVVDDALILDAADACDIGPVEKGAVP